MLEPMNDISFKKETDKHYTKGGDPFFLVNLGKKVLPAGWYLLSIEINEIKDKVLAPRLYYNYGRGVNEQDIWKLPKVTGTNITSLVHFPYGITELRLDPGTTKGVLSSGNSI
jgi:hypothetical protein